MAEFQEVCKHLKRMCGRYGDNCIKCPLENKDFCSLSAGDRTTETYKKAEEIIMSWAAEHPEPVYPTWIAWLMSEGVIPTNYMAANSTDSGVRAGTFFVTSKAFAPIPTNVAEKLGIEPKEGQQCGMVASAAKLGNFVNMPHKTVDTVR